MEGNDYRKQNEKDESSRMHGVFNDPNLGGLHAPQGRKNRGDEKPAAVERGKRQKIERSKVDRKECRDGKDDSNANFGRNEIDEEPPYGYRPSDSLGRFLTFGRSFGHDELS